MVLGLQSRSLTCFPNSVFKYTDTHNCFVSGVLSSNNVLKFEMLVSKMRCCTC